MEFTPFSPPKDGCFRVGFSPPKDGCFRVGSTEKMASISTGGTMPRNKRWTGHRRFNKSRPFQPISAVRENLQRSVAFRSSALRQGKLAQARAGPDSSEFDAVQEAARKACVAPLIARMMKQAKNSKRPRKAKFSRCFDHETPYDAASAGNTNILVNKDSDMQSPMTEVHPSAG